MKIQHTLKEFFLNKKLIHFRKREIILLPEDTKESIYFIEKGFVKVYSLTVWGDEKLHIIYQTNELFPLLWIFDNIPITKYYETLESVAVRRTSKKEFLTFLKSHPEVLFEITQKIINLLDDFTDRVETLEFTNASARFISHLLYLAKRFGEKHGTKIIIYIPITHKDIASSTAMTRETASREFEKLKKKGLVRYINKMIEITDIRKLEEEIEKHYDTAPL